MAMDFCASLEHTIHYEYDGGVPLAVREGLENSARTAAQLDPLTEDLQRQVHGDGPAEARRADPVVPSDSLETLRLIRESRR
ncbi:hypothetical protein A7K94_0202900 [Modestobacter sp. VKM Ac-2676]|nr:hypothetical protein A7K94_0202900 [Modestobacter sp. VKM Ac-2676]